MKPDQKIYEIAIKKFSLTPGETIYIDDLPANCEAGSAIGLQTICYHREKHSEVLDSVSRILS